MNSLNGAITNVTSAWTQLIDAFLEDKGETRVRKVFEVWTNILIDFKNSITGVKDTTKELMKNWSDLAEVRTQIERAEKYPIYTTVKGQLGGNTLADLKEKEAIILSAQDKIIASMGDEAKSRAKNNEESKTSNALAKDNSALQKELIKDQTQNISLQEKYNVMENNTKNAMIEAQIKDLNRYTEIKINSYELEKTRINELAETGKIKEQERYNQVSEIETKIYSLKVQLAEKETTLKKTKQAEVKSDFDAWWAAYLKVESYEGKLGTVGLTKAKGDQYAIGIGQALPTTLMKPGYGMEPFKPAVDQNILSHKDDRVWLKSFLTETEPALNEWTKKYAELRWIANNGDNEKTFVGVGDAKHIQKYIDALDTINGKKIKDISLNEDSKDLEKILGDLRVDYAGKRAELQKKLHSEQEKEIKLTASQTKEVKKLIDAEQDRYNKATMSETQYYKEKLKHTEKSPGVLLSSSEVDAISGLNDKANRAENTKTTYEQQMKAMESYAYSVDTVTQKYAGLDKTAQAVFESALGGATGVVGALDNMVTLLAKNAEGYKKLAIEKKKLDAIVPDQKKNSYMVDLKTQADARKKYETDYQTLQQDTFNQYVNGTSLVASALTSMMEDKKQAEIAQQAVALVTLGIQAVQAIVSQGQGDPYTAFARIAAMAAIVGTLVSSVGGSAPTVPGGKGGGTSPTTDSGTVLGDKKASSQSIDKTYQLLKDIHAEEYSELRGINSGVAALSGNITNTITRLYQSGGITDNASLLMPSKKLGLGQVSLKGKGTISTDLITGLPGLGIATALLANLLQKYDPVQKLLNKIFFGTVSEKIVGGGIATNPFQVGDQVTGSQYATIERTRKSWISKKSSFREALTELDENTKNALTDVFTNMGDVMSAIAGTLGTQIGRDIGSRVSDYIVPSLRIELRGLSAEEAAKRLNGVISATLDTMATVVFGDIIGQYQQLGEGMLETAIRIVAEVAIVQDALSVSNLKIHADVIGISDSLVQMAGGLEAFKAAFENYYDKFFTDKEKQDRLFKNLSEQLGYLGLKLPETRQGYRKLVEALDINNTKDQERYTLLMKLATGADTLYKSLENVSNTLSLLDESKFKTLVDYTRYLRLAQLAGIDVSGTILPPDSTNTFIPNGQAASNNNPTIKEVMAPVVNSTDSNTEEVKQLRREMEAQNIAIAQNTAMMTKIMRKWDGEGMPAVRT
jgi:hypothetical protein